MIKKKISIIIPIYNEDTLLEESLKKIFFFFSKNFKKFEIIIVESGSTDNTKKICNKIKKNFKEVKIIHQKNRLGFGSALKKGFKCASGEFIAIYTVDLIFDLKYFIKATKLMEHYDCILGYRINDKRPFFRRLQTIIFNLITKNLLGLKVRNINSALKLYRPSFIKKIKIKSNSWVIDSEIIYNIFRKKIKFKEIPVVENIRKDGKSSVRLIDSIFILIEIIIFFINNRVFNNYEK